MGAGAAGRARRASAACVPAMPAGLCRVHRNEEPGASGLARPRVLPGAGHGGGCSSSTCAGPARTPLRGAVPACTREAPLRALTHSRVTEQDRPSACVCCLPMLMVLLYIIGLLTPAVPGGQQSAPSVAGGSASGSGAAAGWMPPGWGAARGARPGMLLRSRALTRAHGPERAPAAVPREGRHVRGLLEGSPREKYRSRVFSFFPLRSICRGGRRRRPPAAVGRRRRARGRRQLQAASEPAPRAAGCRLRAGPALRAWCAQHPHALAGTHPGAAHPVGAVVVLVRHGAQAVLERRLRRAVEARRPLRRRQAVGAGADDGVVHWRGASERVGGAARRGWWRGAGAMAWPALGRLRTRRYQRWGRGGARHGRRSLHWRTPAPAHLGRSRSLPQVASFGKALGKGRGQGGGSGERRERAAGTCVRRAGTRAGRARRPRHGTLMRLGASPGTYGTVLICDHLRRWRAVDAGCWMPRHVVHHVRERGQSTARPALSPPRRRRWQAPTAPCLRVSPAKAAADRVSAAVGRSSRAKGAQSRAAAPAPQLSLAVARGGRGLHRLLRVCAGCSCGENERGGEQQQRGAHGACPHGREITEFIEAGR